MSSNYISISIIVILLIIIGVLITGHVLQRRKLHYIQDILSEIEQGNMKRRLLARNSDSTADICYKINHIVMDCEKRLAGVVKAEQINKQLMTSLSHDIRTPLTSLIGYLDAINNEVVTGSEKENYYQIVRNKAYDLKDYMEMLFEWFKLNSRDRIFHFEKCDINELSRKIMIDWIPQFEKYKFSYDISIPDDELTLNIDISAYTRILNNLIQNALVHSNGNYIQVKIDIDMEANNIILTVCDNGQGISEKELPYIFERLYKCDEARSSKGSGLGLYIASELIKAHHGDIEVKSMPSVLTTFLIYLPIDGK